MKGRWFSWLAAELVAAALLAGCAGIGDEESAKSAERHPPVVVVVFDEFPTDDLLGPNGRIDAERYPNFAELASMSTWFPNGYTAYDSTFKAVPSILDGRLPKRGTAPDVRSHKPSVFHLMDRLGYGVFKVESASAVCPPDICPDARTRRPGVLARLAGGGRPARFHQWIGAIRRRPEPTFYFHHALMPHEPWIYLPSGRQSRPAGNDPVEGINKLPGFDDPDLSVHNHLRHLLQVGYTDHQIGELLARLRRTGLLERALIVVTADHGYSFQVGVRSRRLLSERNVEEIAPVPFFVKAPGQTEGRLDEGLVRNVDIVATIADLLDTSVFWKQNGHSAFSAATRARREFAVNTRDFAQVVRIGLPEMERRRATWRRRWARLFGTGIESQVLYGDPWAMAYRIGPRPELLGRRVSALRVQTSSIRAAVANAALFRDVSHSAKFFPTRVTGPLTGVPFGEHRDVAVAVNGRIRAVGRSFDLWRKGREYFSLMVPETALHAGRNRVDVFEVLPSGALAPLAHL
ncbi:MAG TPA: sulfatase-like hydrolase/transferase [Thermoleophilaceae bacterium]